MKEVFERLYVGDDADCERVDAEWAVVHACKHPCHQTGVGYSGNLSQEHPEYLVAERERDLYLNLVDMDRPLDHGFTEPIMTAALDFIEDQRSARDVLVHCNQGMSRSPAMALLYLTKRAGAVPDTDYQTARDVFVDRYPRFQPGNGVETYLQQYWDQLA